MERWRQELLSRSTEESRMESLVQILIWVVVLAVGVTKLRWWITARFSNVPFSLGQLLAMTLRRVPPSRIVKPCIRGVTAGVDVHIDQTWQH